MLDVQAIVQHMLVTYNRTPAHARTEMIVEQHIKETVDAPPRNAEVYTCYWKMYLDSNWEAGLRCRLRMWKRKAASSNWKAEKLSNCIKAIAYLNIKK